MVILSLDNWNIVHKVLIYVINILTIKNVGLKLLRVFPCIYLGKTLTFFPVIPR